MDVMHPAEYSFDDPSFRELLECFPIGVLLLDPDDKIKFINQNFYEFGICSKDDENCVEGVNAGSFPFFKDHDLLEKINSLKSGDLFEKELLNRRTISGGRISILVKAAPAFSGDTNKGAVIIVEDISDSKDVSSEKLAGSDVFNELLNNLFNYFIITAEDGIVKYMSDNFINSEIAGSLIYQLESVINSENPDLSNKLKAGYQLLRNEKKLTSFKVSLENSAYKFTLVPFINSSGSIQTVAVLIKDISEKEERIKDYQDELRELKRYHEITSTIVDAVINLFTIMQQ